MKFDDRDFQEEVRAHLEMATAERMADGADRKSAELASLKDFGNVAITTEAARRVWIPSWVPTLHDFGSYIRYRERVLVQSSIFALTIVAVLALGVGVNAAVWTLLKSMALNPLAGVSNSSRLGIIVNETQKGRKAG